MHFRTTAIIGFVGQLVLVIVSIVLAMAGWHYWALVWGIVTQSVATVAAAWIVCRWTPRIGRVAPRGNQFWVEVCNERLCAFRFQLLNAKHGWHYTSLAGGLAAPALGFYKKAYDLFVMAETQLLAPISAVAVGTLSRVSRDREQFQRYFLRGIAVLALLGMGIGADLALVGRDLIRFLLGPGWEERFGRDLPYSHSGNRSHVAL